MLSFAVAVLLPALVIAASTFVRLGHGRHSRPGADAVTVSQLRARLAEEREPGGPATRRGNVPAIRMAA